MDSGQTPSNRPQAGTPSGALGRVLEVERAAAERIERARGEADRIVEEARDRIRRRERELDAELEEAGARIERRVDAWRERKLEEVRREEETRMRRFREAPPETVERMAARVVGVLLGPETDDR
ncbi:MAG TPA: hypothetical protein VKB18_07310 [Gemmatimonadota bacterium]|nr:hypothetical protein [Gemmatimonadota bacterium]